MGIMMLIAVEIFSTALLRIFCENTLIKRENTKAFEYIVWGGYSVIFNLVTYLFTGTAWINMLVFVTIFFVAIKILYQNLTRTLIAVTVFLYLSGMCAELLVFYGKELLPEVFQAGEEIQFVVLSKLVWFCIIKLVSIFVKMNKKIELNIQDWLEVFMIPVASIWILVTFFNQRTTQEDSFLFVVVVVIMIINICTYYLYDKVKVTMEKRKQEEILMQQRDYYLRQNKENTECLEELRQFRHDMKQRYMMEKIFLEKGDYDGLENYCNNNLKFLNKNSNLANTGNIYIDSIINYKAEMAEKQGIQFAVELDVPKDVELNAEDLSICLGNLLDNAIEAAEELDEDKVIHIKIEADGKNLFINMKNKYNGERRKRGRKYLTGKGDSEQHGLGLKIIQKIVDKYEGEFNIHEIDKEFEVVVLLYDFLQ